MKFGLFVYCTVGRRHELEAGMAGRNPVLYRRMLAELADYARFAETRGYFGFGHPEHHLQIEGFEIANDPALMAMWLGQHTETMRIVTCGFVSTANNPLATAEKIATMDHMLGGRLGIGLVRGYQARWVENFKVRPDLRAVGPWTKDTPDDDLNRRYFTEFVEVVTKALANETFSHRGEFWTFPPTGFVNPHQHPVYTRFGRGVNADMRVDEIGIAPRPLQAEIPLYGGFSASLRTAKFWARYKGRPIVLSGNTEFLQLLWREWREEAEGLRSRCPARPGSVLGRHHDLRGNGRQGPGAVRRHAVVLGHLGDALRTGSSRTPGRFSGHPQQAHRAHLEGGSD